MTVPVVAELSAWTSVYGRLAPLPPVADASAGWTAMAATPAAARDTAAALSASIRLRSRTEWDTGAPPWIAGRRGRADETSLTLTVNISTSHCKISTKIGQGSTD